MNTLANIKSAKKRIKITEFRTARNRSIKSAIKTAIRRFEEALAAGNFEEAQSRMQYAEKKIRQAVAKARFIKIRLHEKFLN